MIQALFSDQSQRWSANHDRALTSRAQATPQAAPSQAATAGYCAARLADRAVQAVWQSTLQMRDRSWSWSQVLPFGKPFRWAATDGLRSASRPGLGERVLGQLPPCARDPRRGIADQPGVVASATAAVRCARDPGTWSIAYQLRLARWRQAAGQHARCVSRCRPRAPAHGGQR